MKKTKNGLVSIICAVHNEERTLKDCVNSLLSQTYENIEIIIVNDGSTDKSAEIAEELSKKSKKIKIINIEYLAKGCVRPRVAGIKNSSGDFIFVVDADAYYSPDYLERCLSKLKDKNVGGAIGKIRVWNPKTFLSKYRDVLYRLRWNDEKNMEREINDGKIAAWIFRRSDYEKLGGYNESIEYGEDVDFTRMLLKNGYKVKYVPDALWYHRWKENFSDILPDHYEKGVQNFSLNKNSFRTVLKVIFFLLPIPILAAGIFYPPILMLLPIHMLPMFANGLTLFRRSKSEYKYYALLSPIVAYVQNIPYALGFVVGWLKSIK